MLLRDPYALHAICTSILKCLIQLYENEADPCHKFAWCLDACIRAGFVDEKKSRELYSFLEGIGSGNEALGDVAMLLRDPYALHAICTSILKCLIQLYENYALPRESSELECLLRLLQLGTCAHGIMESEAYHETSLDVELIIKFLPELLSIMSENTLRAIAHKKKEEYRPFTPSQHFINSLSNPCAMHITCTYALHLLTKKELKSFCLVLPLIAKGYTRSDSAQLPDIFLHLLVVRLLEYPVPIRELTMQTILREFWLVCALGSETALLHLCHLLWGLHPRINPHQLEDILDEMKPGEAQSEVAHQQYRTLVEHIENSYVADKHVNT
jgi:negative elongation factor B